VLALLVAATCVRLGIWQLARRHQRRARNAAAVAARDRPPVELSGAVAAESVLDRRVHARGVYDFANERMWRPRSFEDMPGVDLVTPLRLPDGSAVLVDRGWARSADAYHVDQSALREPDSTAIVGLALAAPRGHGDVDPKRESLPYRLLPFVVQALPDGRGAGLRRWPAPELTDGPHLSYAIQWFSFATIIVVGLVVLVRKERSERELPRTGLSH
jgi:surfeit locus 1 family protein